MDLTGQHFGKLTVIGRDKMRDGNITYWLCKCDCGSSKIASVARGSLTRGLTRSCGCLKSKTKKEDSNKYDLSGEYGIGWTSNTNNEFYFDLEDFDKIKGYCWYENDSGYIVSQRGRKTIRMHRLIMNVIDKEIQIDHIFHNTHDNRKQYLRPASNTENSWNKKTTGVYYSTEKNKYVANLTYYGKKITKYFDDFDDAIEYRKDMEQKYFGEFAYNEME